MEGYKQFTWSFKMSDLFQKSDVEIFNKRFALTTKYLPKNLIARDQQINEVVNLVRPMLSYGEPKNAMIYGKTGTGKTVVVKYVLNKLEKKTKEENFKISSVFINCKAVNTTIRIILEILDTIAPEEKIQRSGLSTSEYYNFLWKILNQKGLSVIIVFDEIDQLNDHNILYNLSRAGENQNLEFENSIGIIGLSNDLFFSDQIEPRIISSLNSRDFVFPPYNANQLIQILEDRVDIAFEKGVLDYGVIPLCAAYSAQEHGDARKALMLLENAGEIAECENAQKVLESHVKKGYELLNTNCLLEMVKTLPIQSKIILYTIIELVRKKGKITTGQVEEHYKEICKKVGFRVLERTSISKLISELDMIGLVNAPVQHRGRFGKTRLISLCNDDKLIENVLFEDPSLKNLAPIFTRPQ